MFDDKLREPKERELVDALGETKQLWDDLHGYLAQEFESVTAEWKFYSKKSGWVLKLSHKKHTILYMRPIEGAFVAILVYGEKAVAAASKSRLPKRIISQINDATKYVEGRQIRVDVKRDKDLNIVRKLVTIKMAN